MVFFTYWRFVAGLPWANLSVPLYHCSLRVSLSHTGNSHSILNFVIIIIFFMVISNLWCYCCKKMMTRWRLRWWLTTFSSIFKLMYVYWVFFFWDDAIEHLIDYNICIGKPKKSCDSLYCNICFIKVVWNQTYDIPEFCLTITFHSIWREVLNNFSGKALPTLQGSPFCLWSAWMVGNTCIIKICLVIMSENRSLSCS